MEMTREGMVDPGANASQDSPETVETVTEEVEVEERPRRYELDPEPESEAESPPAGEEKADSKTSEDRSNVKTAHDRINMLTENWRTAERATNDLLAENEELRRRLMETGPGPAPQEGAAPQGDEIPPRKTLADFDYDDAAFMEYVDQRNEAIIRQSATRQQHEQLREQAFRERHDQHRAREQAYMKEVPDYMETVKDVPVNQPMLEMIESSEVGPDLVYYLGKNPDVAVGLVNSPSPLEMARRVALIEREIKVVKEEASQVKSASKAPAPTKKVRAVDPGKVVAASDPDSDKLSDKEWLERRNRELKAQR